MPPESDLPPRPEYTDTGAMESNSLANQLLIAMPQLDDPGFEQSVTYIIEHSAEGAMGLTLNRPISLTLAEILQDIGIPQQRPISGRHQVLSGGPVQQEAGFILHPPTAREWDASGELEPGLWMTTSKDILEAIAAGEGPDQSLIILGYAGWDNGQLEQELADNAWLTTPASLELIFDVPFSQRWQAAARQLGVDMSLISTQAGRA